MFHRFLKVAERCPRCGEELFHQRADDAPPYFVMLIVGHVVVLGVLTTEMTLSPPLWLQMIGWPAAALALSLVLLQPVKGALVALQWALRMHGFDAAMRGQTAPLGDFEAWAGEGQGDGRPSIR